MLPLIFAAAASSCAVANRPATLLVEPKLTLPANVALHDVRAVRLRITVGANGSVRAATVTRTSGDRAVDAQALLDVRTGGFEPAVVACAAVEKAYEIVLRYDPAQLGPGGCAEPSRGVRVVKLSPPAVNEYDRGDGEVILDLEIEADGSLSGYRVQKSSGSIGLDNQVILSAKQTTFSPRLEHCAPVPGHYIFRFKL